MRHIISLGAGVQSSTMALMAAHGEIEPMPELAIFADTGWEPAAVYEWLAWLEQRLPFPVVRVSAGNIRNDHENAHARTTMPFFQSGGASGRAGPVRRKCTVEYKVEPIELYLRRELLGLAPRQRSPKHPVIAQWRGISRDEAARMKPSSQRWMAVRYPLAMEHAMSRADCIAWMARNGYPEPPRSACIGCPFHSNHEWRRIRDEAPDEWVDAVAFDAAIRDTAAAGLDRPTYLHRDCVPLDEVDLDTAEDRGQQDWINECEGMCGV